MAIKFSYWFIFLKIVDFVLVTPIFWDAADCTRSHLFCQNFSGGACPRTPLQQCDYTMLWGHLHTCYVSIFLGNLSFLKGFFDECLSDIYLLTCQCKRTGGCYYELVVAFFSTGAGVKGKKIYTCWLYDLFINLHLFYLWRHLVHRPPVTLQFMALPSNFGDLILGLDSKSNKVWSFAWHVLFSSVTA